MLRVAMTSALLSLVTLTQISSASAQNYPTRQITIMPLLAAGTGLDTVVRLYSEHLSQTLGRTVVVENRPGNAGLVGVAALKAAPADGHTLMVATSAVMAIRPSLLKQPPYDPVKDFVPLALYVKSPFILVVNPALPVRSVPDLIKYVKERPGKLSYSSPSVGGAPHLVGRVHEAAVRIGYRPRPIQEQPAVDCRRRRRPHRSCVRGGWRIAAADPGRQAACARGVVGDAIAQHSRYRAVRRSGRNPRFRSGVVARPGGARGHAAGHRNAAARGNEAHHDDPRGEQEGGGASA